MRAKRPTALAGVAMGLLLLAACGQPVLPKAQTGVFVFDSVTDNRATVLDFDAGYVWVQDKRYPTEPSSGGDIGGGGIFSCSDEKQICMEGPFLFRIPRQYPTTGQLDARSNCKIMENLEDGFRLSCMDDELPMSIVYSPANGIQTFSWHEGNWPQGEQEVAWKLRTHIGPLAGGLK